MTQWMKPGNNAVITGGASGIGLAAARRFLAADMQVLISDIDEDALHAAGQELGGGLLTHACDVSQYDDVQALQKYAAEQMGVTHCLMNNAGAGVRTPSPWEDLESWKKQIDINLWGIVHGCHAFLPSMLDARVRCAVINTGSKQGITNPPGNYAYNMSKCAVKAYTESVAHALRQEDGGKITAHLMIPGFTYTGMIARFVPEKPAGAWLPEQAVDFMLSALERDAFYILCPDNDTPRELDAKRIQWAVDDLLQDRSALSRWDPAFKDGYDAFLAN